MSDQPPATEEKANKSFLARQPAQRAPGQRSIAFEARRWNECPWPEWVEPNKTGLVCGLPSAMGKKHPWCHHHYRLVFRPRPRP